MAFPPITERILYASNVPEEALKHIVDKTALSRDWDFYRLIQEFIDISQQPGNAKWIILTSMSPTEIADLFSEYYDSQSGARSGF